MVESRKLAFAHDVSEERGAISGREVQISLKMALDKQVWAWVMLLWYTAPVRSGVGLHVGLSCEMGG